MSTTTRSRFLDRTTPPHILTLVLVAGLPALSMNLFTPSLPNMAEFFRVEYQNVQIAIPLYLWMNAALQIVIGPLSDKYGRRQALLWSFGLFTVASVGCVLAPTIEVFLVFRACQAVAASGIALSRAVVRDMYDRENSASMIGYVVMGMALVPMIGPMIGGLLDQSYGWQASFSLLVIFGLLVWAMVFFDLGETKKKSDASILRQFAEYPELLGSRRFWGYSLSAAFSAGVFFAFVGGSPFIATEIYHLTPFAYGAYFGITAFGYMVGNFLSGRYSVRFGIMRMMVVGSVLVTVGLVVSLVLTQSGVMHPMALFGPTVFVGVGNGLVMPNANAGLVSVRPHLAGTASGLGGAIMIGGGAGLAAITGFLMETGHPMLGLLMVMFASSLIGILCTLYVRWIDLREGPTTAQHV